MVPRVLGGQHTWQNLVCACVACNARKGGRTPVQAHMKLIRKPYKPRRNPVISMRLGDVRYRSWKAFLDEAYWTVELRD
ncbi:MAG: HNH endonuclease [Planctomycetota bacterium]